MNIAGIIYVAFFPMKLWRKAVSIIYNKNWVRTIHIAHSKSDEVEFQITLGSRRQSKQISKQQQLRRIHVSCLLAE